MKILHINLEAIEGDLVEFRYYWDNPNQSQTYEILLRPLAGLRRRDYTEDYVTLGQTLYKWLDGEDHILQRQIDKQRDTGIVLAISSTSQGLTKLPWEVLHDGQAFLVSCTPAILPVRWLKNSSNSILSFQNAPAERALNVLFMASSARGIEPELDVEAIPIKIKEATTSDFLSLSIEESGCLFKLIKTQKEGDLDLLHLVGQTTFKDGQPYFITETELGEAQYNTAQDLAKGLNFKFPKLIFLSGCSVGYSSKDSISAMTEELVKCGAQAVLSWGQPVIDQDTLAAAAILYQELKDGRTLVESISRLYQTLLKIGARDWPSLRLYVMGTLSERLVTGGVKVLPSFPPTEPLMPRRHLQNCLRVLKTRTTPEIGIFIQDDHKSMITAGLSDILWDYQKITWQRQINETSLVSQLVDKLEDSKQEEILQNPEIELKYRLRDILSQLNTISLLFILDQFEWNLDYQDNKYILKQEVVENLKSLIWAIKDTNSLHRIIITCSYKFDCNLFYSFYSLPSEKNSEKSEEEIISEFPIYQDIQEVISRCLIFQIAVPIPALEAVCDSLCNHQQKLRQAIELGLIEVSSQPDESYRVTPILSHILPSLAANKENQSYLLYAKASQKLHQLWGNKENENEKEWGEIFRLSLGDRSDPQRFRKEFSKMLAVQYNSQADLAYEKELRKFKNELSTENLLEELENYLKKGQWKAADQETAWIFYQMMIITRTRGFRELYEQIPCDILKNLDQLWVDYSGGKFGFSVQHQIYDHLSKAEKDNQEVWTKFGDLIGWRLKGEWLEYNALPFNLRAFGGNLPALYSTGSYADGWGIVGNGLGWYQWWGLARRMSSLASRLSKCSI